jgi:hypothetical protein
LGHFALFGFCLLCSSFKFLEFSPLLDEYIASIFFLFCRLSLPSVECFLCCVETF